GKTLIFSTHQMDQVEELCEAITIIDRGRVVESGPLREVKRRMGRQVVRLAVDETDGAATTTAGGELPPSSDGLEWVEQIPGVTLTRRGYLIRVRTRTFAILTVAIAIVGIALTLLPLGIRVIGGDKPSRIAVYSTAADLSVDPVATLQASLNASGAGGGSQNGSRASRFSLVATSDPASAKDQVRTDKL